MWLSSVLQIPPKKIERYYDAVAVFTIPKSELENKLIIHIAGRDENMKSVHGLPNQFVGSTDPVDKTLL